MNPAFFNLDITFFQEPKQLFFMKFHKTKKKRFSPISSSIPHFTLGFMKNLKSLSSLSIQNIPKLKKSTLSRKERWFIKNT
jgi:hypothetical protein